MSNETPSNPAESQEQVKLGVFSAEVQRNLQNFTSQELQELSRKILTRFPIELSPKEINQIREQSLKVNQSQFTQQEEEQIKTVLMHAEILKKIKHSTEEDLQIVLKDYHSQLKNKLTAQEITKLIKTSKITTFLQRQKDDASFDKALEEVYFQVYSLKLQEITELRRKIKSKKIQDLLQDEKLEIKKMYKRRLEQGVDSDALISSLYERALKQGG